MWSVYSSLCGLRGLCQAALCNDVIEFVLNSVICCIVSFTSYITYVTCYYSITIVQRHTGKYHKFVSVCIVRVSSMSNNAKGNK